MPTNAVRVVIENLHPLHYPARLLRIDGVSILIMDPHAQRTELIGSAGRVAIEGDELAQLFCAYPDAESWEGNKLTLLYVPPELRLPGYPPLQGGEELLRRIKAQELDEELRLLDLERTMNPDLRLDRMTERALVHYQFRMERVEIDLRSVITAVS